LYALRPAKLNPLINIFLDILAKIKTRNEAKLKEEIDEDSSPEQMEVKTLEFAEEGECEGTND